MSKRLFQALLNWLPLAIAITLFSGMLYVVVQQDLRQTANDPQIQIARDAATFLASGQRIEAPLLPPKIDISQSLAPFVIVVDTDGNVTQASGLLDGQALLPPDGVFVYAKLNGENKFSWEPQTGVRLATIVKYFSGSYSGYVIVGRSLAEVEQREDQLLLIIAIFWVGALILTYTTKLFVRWFSTTLE